MIGPRLRQQSRLAAVFLFAPWLVTVFWHWSLLTRQPAAIPLLLPGLAVTIYLQRQLSRNLAANHRYKEEGRLFPTLGAANWITLLRGSAVVALAGFLPMAFQRDHNLANTLPWLPGLIYLGISLADLLDGFVARKQDRQTELGKRLDIETDAAGILAASLLAVSLGRLPAVYLLVGLAYYPFILGIRLRQQRGLPLVALQPRPFARFIAGCQMGLVGMALLPVFKPEFTFSAAIIFMTPLLAGFVRDWLVVSCRLETDRDQLTALDRWIIPVWTRVLPLMLRLIILAGGITMLIGGGVHQTHLSWQLALSICCLLAGLGVMGRSAGLFLVLLLGSSLSPFGVTMPSMVLFGAAATLMLTGSGIMSLWSPEETILFCRRSPLPQPERPSRHEVFDLTGADKYHHQ